MRSRPRLLASAAVAAAGKLTGQSAQAAAQPQPPDIIVVVLDDMRDTDWQALPQTQETLGDRGTTFPYFLCATPLCTPSRISLITGRYSHNHGVLGNSHETGGWSRFADLGFGPQTIQNDLQAAGYRTALVGKFISGTPASGQVSEGRDTWYCQTDFRYERPRINDNGRSRRLGTRKYSTDVLRDNAIGFIHSTPAGQPLFLHFSPIAPHNNPRAARRHKNAFRRTGLGGSPALNESDVSDKPQYVRERGALSRKTRKNLNRLNRDRLRTLLAADGAIQSISSALERSGRASNALVFVLSDNGFLLGHHRYTGETTPYDHADTGRLVACGPGFAAGAVDERLASIVDLAPTMAEAAGIDLPDADGLSLVHSYSRDDSLV